MARMKLHSTYGTMVTMRRFEEAVAAATAAGEIHGEMHVGLGQEAVGAALAVALRPGDALVSTHRPHLHALALGVDPVELLAELLERDGLCHGKGGHMHLFDPARRFMCTGIVGANVPLALGYAFAQQREGAGAVTLALVGDGALQQGGVLESLNLAALWRLPLVVLCEDNGYGISVRRDAAAAGPLEARGEPFGIPGVRVDGTDPEAVLGGLEPMIARARRREGQGLLVASCYRFSGHYEGDPDAYRTKDEKEAAMSPARDPVARLADRLMRQGATRQELRALEERAAERVEEWLAAARAHAYPALDTLREGVFA